MKIVNIKGQVLDAIDEYRDLPVKDKDGNPTDRTKNHRMTSIKILYKNETGMTMILCKGFDLPQSFKLPEQGKDWEIPRVVNLSDRPGQSPEISFQC